MPFGSSEEEEPRVCSGGGDAVFQPFPATLGTGLGLARWKVGLEIEDEGGLLVLTPSKRRAAMPDEQEFAIALTALSVQFCLWAKRFAAAPF